MSLLLLGAGKGVDSAAAVAPVLSVPTGTKTASTTATVGVTTDTGSGTLYGVITTSSTPPTAAQIKAGQDSSGSAAMVAFSQTVSGTGAQSKNATGLTANNAPYCHFVHNSTGGDSNVVSTTALLGAELVTNGSFSATTDWNLDGVTTISGGTVNFANSTGFGCWQAAAAIVAGHTYRAVYTITSYTSGTAHQYVGSSGTPTGLARTSAGTFSDDLTPSSSNEIGFFLANFVGIIDNYSVKEVL